MSFQNTKIYFLLIVFIVCCYADSAEDTTLVNNPDSSISAGADTTKSKQNSITDTVYYESMLISYDNEAKILYLTGNAHVKYQQMQLIADTIVYTIDNDLFTATGLPRLIEGNDTTIGDYMVYNIKTRRGRVRYASTSLTEGSFYGSNIIKTEDNMLYVDQGDYTTCAQVETPHYFFYGKSIKVIPNDKIISKPVVMNIGDVPVMVLPFFIFPLDRNRRSGFLTPVWGGHPASGGYIDNLGYYWAPNDYIDFIARCKVNDFREYVVEAGSKYNLKYKFDGHLNARYTFNNEFQKGFNNWAIIYSHNQTLTPDGLTRLTGNGTITSSEDFFTRNSEDPDEKLKQTVSANMSFSKTFDNINASTNLTWRRNHNFYTDVIDEDLPSFSFTFPSRPLIKAPDTLARDLVPWYSSIYYGYNSNGIVKHLDSTRQTDGKEYYRPGAQHTLDINAPQKLFGYIDISPGFSASQYFMYGYQDTAVLRIDTLFDSKSYIKKPPFRSDNLHPQYNHDTIYDTLSRNQYAEPDSIQVTKVRRRIISRHREHEKLAHIEDWNTGIGFSTKLYGIFSIKVINLLGIRHTLTPSLRYRFTPEHNDSSTYYAIGIQPPRPRKKSQTVEIGIGNLFEGKFKNQDRSGKVSEKTSSLLSLNLKTSYDFEKDNRRWSDLSLSANTSIDKLGLSFSYNSLFWLYDQYDNPSSPIMHSMNLDVRTNTLNAKGNLWNGDLLELDSLASPDDHPSEASNKQLQWSASLNPSFSFSMKRNKPGEMFVPQKTFSLSGSASLNFTKAWSFQWNGNYNFQTDNWERNNFSLNCDLECWEMKFNWRPEKLNPGYYFLINIKKIPDIKWEQRENQ